MTIAVTPRAIRSAMLAFLVLEHAEEHRERHRPHADVDQLDHAREDGVGGASAEDSLWAVKWYPRFPLSYHDLERMLADHRVEAMALFAKDISEPGL